MKSGSNFRLHGSFILISAVLIAVLFVLNRPGNPPQVHKSDRFETEKYYLFEFVPRFTFRECGLVMGARTRRDDIRFVAETAWHWFHAYIVRHEPEIALLNASTDDHDDKTGVIRTVLPNHCDRKAEIVAGFNRYLRAERAGIQVTLEPGVYDFSSLEENGITWIDSPDYNPLMIHALRNGLRGDSEALLTVLHLAREDGRDSGASAFALARFAIACAGDEHLRARAVSVMESIQNELSREELASALESSVDLGKNYVRYGANACFAAPK